MTLVLKWKGDEVARQAREGGVEGLRAWADATLAATEPHVPVSDREGGGFLKNTGKAEVDTGALRAAVSYDGPPDKKALPVWVHEDMRSQHKVGEAKFLESTVNGTRDEALRALAAAIGGALA